MLESFCKTPTRSLWVAVEHDAVKQQPIKIEIRSTIYYIKNCEKVRGVHRERYVSLTKQKVYDILWRITIQIKIQEDFLK